MFRKIGFIFLFIFVLGFSLESWGLSQKEMTTNKLKEATYTLRIMLTPQPLETKVQVKAGGKSMCVLKKEAGAWKLGC